MSILLINFLAYILWFIVVFTREKKITVYSFFILFISVIAFLGYYTCEITDIYEGVFGKKNISTLTLKPYVLAFISYWLLFSPLKEIEYRDTNLSFIFSRIFKFAIKCWIIFYGFYCLLRLSELSVALATGLGEMYNTRHNEGEALFEYSNFFLKNFVAIGVVFAGPLTPLVMLYCFVGLYNKKISSSYAVLIILVTFLPNLISSITIGSRGAMLMQVFCFLFFVILLYKYIPRQFLKKIYTTIVAGLFIVLTYSWMITIDRVGNAGGFDSILRYFGEPFPNLGFSFWNKVNNHPMGARFYPEILMSNTKLIGSSVKDSHLFWENITGVPILNFKTFFGDMYIEFGVLIAMSLTVLLSIVFRRIIKRNITILNISLVYYYFQLCVYSFGGFSKKGEFAIRELLIILTVSLLLNYFLGQKKDKMCLVNNKQRTLL